MQQFTKIAKMGMCASVNTVDATRTIDQQLRMAQEKESLTIKLLLLGTGESGKSTLVKQMRILHANGFTEEEMIIQTKFVYSDTLDAMLSLLTAMNVLEIKFEDPEREADSTLLRRFAGEIEKAENFNHFPEHVTNALKRLWADGGVTACFQRSNEFQLMDSAKYFLDEIDKLSTPNYKANIDDILRVRIRTTGVVELQFTVKNTLFKVIDVGGQRSERKKWLRCFENIEAIIFVAAISEYDQVLYEDNKTNRMEESMTLFRAICHTEFFAKTSFILFLNKMDLFREKITRSPLTIAFPEYTGPQTVDACSDYIQLKYTEVMETPSRNIYPFLTCATDTNQIDNVFNSCIDTVIMKNMNKSGIF